uniref:Uncharacterized protein n=1 Tax=Solanum lycopersicum TaxID=4081 RepID=K4CKE0_SOLLC
MSSSLQDPTPSRARCRPRWSWKLVQWFLSWTTGIIWMDGKSRAGRPLTCAGEGLGSLFFRTLVCNKARRPPAGFEMDQVGHPFTTWVELAVFSIFFNGRK